MRDHPMIDPLDREIVQALAVDPSPEFVARVRRRVETDHARVSWRFRWIVTSAALPAAAVIAIILMLRQVPQPAPLVTRPIAGVVTLPALAGVDLGSDRSRRYHSRKPLDARGQSHRSERRVELEILVDAREADAMHQVLDRLTSGRLYLTPFVVAEQPIYIAPIDIKGVQP